MILKVQIFFIQRLTFSGGEQVTFERSRLVDGLMVPDHDGRVHWPEIRFEHATQPPRITQIIHLFESAVNLSMGALHPLLPPIPPPPAPL